MSLKIDDYLSNASYRADNESSKEFGTRLMNAFKQKNLSEGINAGQALWLHSRLRALQVNCPGVEPCQVDILNMALSGDLEAGALALMFCVPDDMSQPYHWFSQERIDWILAQLKTQLGWE